MVPASVLAIPAIALLGASVGIWLANVRAFAKWLAPFGGGVLVGVALAWVLPELSEYYKWPGAIAAASAGVLALVLVDRYVHPVCPACAPAHDHEHCHTRLHGFALPLLAAAALHSALDGWSVMAAGSFDRVGPSLAAAIAIHKIPEGIALGVIARAALTARSSALAWCAAAQAATPVGALLEMAFAPYLGSAGLYALLALAGGSFLYLGGHAVHGEFRRSGAKPAMVPALAGVAGSGALRLFLR